MTIDIIIPTMGRSLTLIRSVRSAVVSLLPSMRIIVINDGEVNVTKLLHDVFEKEINDGHIVILKNSGIHGASAARNFGAEASENELMFFLDDDDELIFGSLEQVLLASKQGYNYGFSVSASGIQKISSVQKSSFCQFGSVLQQQVQHFGLIGKFLLMLVSFRVK